MGQRTTLLHENRTASIVMQPTPAMNGSGTTAGTVGRLIPARRSLDSEVIRRGSGWSDPSSPDLAGVGAMGGKRLAIRDDVPAAELRRLARQELDRAAAFAGALEGLTRAEAARLAGMKRQVLCDAVLRYNAKGLAGLHDRPRPGRPPRLGEAQRRTLQSLMLDGPDLEATYLSAWTLGELCREEQERWGVRHHDGHIIKLVRSLGLSRQKARPSHPKADAASRPAAAADIPACRE
jgi:transposase